MLSDPIRRKNWKTVGQVLMGVFVVALIGFIMLLIFADQNLPPGWLLLSPPQDVNALAEYQGDIWSGGKDGLYQIDSAKGELIRKVQLDDGTDFSFTYSLTVEVNHPNLWVGHQHGLSRYDGIDWKTFTKADGLPETPVLAVVEDPGKGLWIASTGGLTYFNFSMQEFITPPEKITGGSFSVLFFDSQGQLFAGNGYSKEGGLITYDGQSWGRITTKDGLAHPMVNSILEEPAGQLWFGTGFSNQGGLSITDGQSWRTITKSDGLAGEKVRFLFQDSSGIIWVGSEYQGIVRMDESGWQTITPNEGLAGWEVKDMLHDQAGRLWLGTENGLTRLDQNTWQNLSN